MKLLNDMIKHKPDTIRLEWRKGIYALQLVLNLIEKQSKEIEKLYKSLEDDIGNIINLGILLDENAREKRDVSIYVDEAQLFLNTLNYNYVSKYKIKSKIKEYKEKCKNCNFRGKICKEFTKNYNCTIAVCLNEFYSLLEKE